ncbi:MAG: hypothetical protein CSB46_08110 [Micrococcales bacterium]|nr:MAG: hypothetical protein CSB46_08110 [Micrococcales bacterium]
MSRVAAVEGPDGVTQVIRPAAVIPETSARRILVEIALRDVRNGGVWKSQPNQWSMYDQPWQSPTDPGPAQLVGTIHLAYGTPTKYEITLYRVTVTRYGTDTGWNVETVTDAALEFGDLTLAECPRAELAEPPPPFTW